MSGWRICIDFGTAVSKAAIAPVHGASWAPGRPIAIGRAAGEDNSYLASSALFLDGETVRFGREALRAAEIAAPQKREALMSFKLLLCADGLKDVLALKPPKPVDPAGAFTFRDLIVTYLAWLLKLVDEALAVEPEVGADRSTAPIRYTRPAWQFDAWAPSHALVARLFDEACTLCAELDGALLAKAGLPFGVLGPALERARASAVPSRVDSCVPEALAAIACHAVSARRERPPEVWLVLDIGAGTADIGAVTIKDNVAQEIDEARKVLAMAGDQLDKVLLTAFLTRARHVRQLEHRAALWRRLLVSAREEKEGLFTDGRAKVHVEGKRVTVRRRDIENDEAFRAFKSVISSAYRQSLQAAAARANAIGASRVAVVLAGGGANLDFVRALAERHAAASPTPVVLHPTVPEWTSMIKYGGQLAPVFPQVAVAVGGAMAPATLLALAEDQVARSAVGAK